MTYGKAYHEATLSTHTYNFAHTHTYKFAHINTILHGALQPHSIMASNCLSSFTYSLLERTHVDEQTSIRPIRFSAMDHYGSMAICGRRTRTTMLNM